MDASANHDELPEADAPYMFGGRQGSAHLPWEWAVERLTEARNYWIATTRPDGRPHSRPVWGIWLANKLYFSTGSLAARNLIHNTALTAHLESGNEVVIIEGTAVQVNAMPLIEQIVALYNTKYHWDMDPQHLPGPFYEVQPQIIFGWLSDPSGLDGGAAFHESTTRWRFR